MKTQTKILLFLVALLLLITTASVSRGASASLNPAVPAGQLTGGRYILVLQAQPADAAQPGNGVPTANGVLTGGRYRLADPDQPADVSGCCCKGYLPCVRK